MCLGSGIMKLGSEGVYLHEKCGTNPSRHLPGLKTAINKKNPILGSRGVRAEILYINSRSTALSGLYVRDSRGGMVRIRGACRFEGKKRQQVQSSSAT